MSQPILRHRGIGFLVLPTLLSAVLKYPVLRASPFSPLDKSRAVEILCSRREEKRGNVAIEGTTDAAAAAEGFILVPRTFHFSPGEVSRFRYSEDILTLYAFTYSALLSLIVLSLVFK